jgi:hypothetical protein
MKIHSAKVPPHTETQRLWCINNKQIILTDISVAIQLYCDHFKSNYHKSRQVINYYQYVLSESDRYKEQKEMEVVPAHKLMWSPDIREIVEPIRIEHIPGTTKVIATYPSRVNLKEE